MPHFAGIRIAVFGGAVGAWDVDVGFVLTELVQALVDADRVEGVYDLVLEALQEVASAPQTSLQSIGGVACGEDNVGRLGLRRQRHGRMMRVMHWGGGARRGGMGSRSAACGRSCRRGRVMCRRTVRRCLMSGRQRQVTAGVRDAVHRLRRARVDGRQRRAERVQHALGEALLDLQVVLCGLRPQMIADDLGDAEKLAERVLAVDGVLFSISVEVQAPSQPERVGREVASCLGVEGAPAVLVQAGFWVVVLAGQAQGLAQAFFTGMRQAVSGVGGGPGHLARVIGQAGGSASEVRVAAEHRAVDPLGQRRERAGQEQEVAGLGEGPGVVGDGLGQQLVACPDKARLGPAA